MALRCVGLDAMDKAALIGKDHIVSPKIKRSDGSGIQWQVRLMIAINARRTIEPTGADVPGSIGGWHKIGRVNGGKYGRLRKHRDHDLQHIFRTADLVEPVVGNGKFHGADCSKLAGVGQGGVLNLAFATKN